MGSGGAVELSWKLRPTSSADPNKFVECRDQDPAQWGPVTRIRLHWQVGDVSCSHAWSCDSNHGTTGFEIPEGTAQLWVTPECGRAQSTPDCLDDQPAALDTYIAPAKVQRDVIRGEIVSLGAVELVVSVFDCKNQPCICPIPDSP